LRRGQRGGDVIFGAVTDDKLKKGEIKITVIAAGFGEGPIRKKEEPLKEEPEKKNKKTPNFEVSQVKEEDEWDIPAFIRRKMK